MNFSSELKKSIKTATIEYIKRKNIAETDYLVRGSAIIFKSSEGKNLNFHPKSFSNILEEKSGDWANRLKKKHTHFKDETKEMESSNSSDALLMNIFCHPSFSKWNGPRKYLGFEDAVPEFGWIPKIEESAPYTEVDMKLGSTIYEAKLTESDFTEKEMQKVLERYHGIEEIFDLDQLKVGSKIKHYQLLRNIYAANKRNLNFVVLLDSRRIDLLQALFETMKAIKNPKLRYRIGFITWQEISRLVGKDVKEFLKLKYSI